MSPIHIPLLFAVISSSSLDNIDDKTTDIIDASKVAELRELFLNLSPMLACYNNRITSAIILVIIGRW